MTADERKLVDCVKLILGRSMAIALPAEMANKQIAKWEDELGPGLLSIVRRLDAENATMRAELTRLLDVVGHDEDFDNIKRVLKGEK